MRSWKIQTKAENAIKIWLLALAFMIIGLGSSNVFAMDLLGPPTAELEKGMFRGGIDYSFSNMDLELIEGEGSIYFDNAIVFEGDMESEIIKDFKVNTLYATVGYGIIENYEVFLRMGIANATFGDTLLEEGEDFESNFNFAIGGGFKATVYEGFNLKIGGVFQINWAELDGQLDSSSWDVPQPHLVEISTTEMQLAMGVTYLYSSRISIYGGPLIHFISGNFDYKFSRFRPDDGFTDTREYSWEINEGPTYGGYIGTQIEIVKNSTANLEYQQTSNGNVFGVNVMMRY